MIIATNTNVCRNLVLLAPGSGSLKQCGGSILRLDADWTRCTNCSQESIIWTPINILAGGFVEYRPNIVVRG